MATVEGLRQTPSAKDEGQGEAKGQQHQHRRKPSGMMMMMIRGVVALAFLRLVWSGLVWCDVVCSGSGKWCLRSDLIARFNVFLFFCYYYLFSFGSA